MEKGIKDLSVCKGFSTTFASSFSLWTDYHSSPQLTVHMFWTMQMKRLIPAARCVVVRKRDRKRLSLTELSAKLKKTLELPMHRLRERDNSNLGTNDIGDEEEEIERRIRLV